MNHYSYYPGVLQFEISSNCNARCPGCARNLIIPSDDPAVNTDITNIQTITHPDIPKNVYLDLEVFKSIFSDRVKQKLECIEFIGSIDDPLMHSQFLEMLEFITEHVNHVRIVIHSNASLRTPEYFFKMANILKKARSHKFAFSIDGLEDTNHLYRRNTKWNKIIENAQAFIAAGGNASWQYLIFPWNEHQIEDAKTLAKEMGFIDFRARNNRGLNLDFKGESQRSNRKVDFNIAKTHFDLIAKESEIDCVMRPRGMYFINYEGNVWPCCFLNNQFYTKYGVLDENYQRFEGNYGKNWNNLYNYTFDEILDTKFYTEDLTDSWDTKIHGPSAKDRVMKCTGTCCKKSLEKIPFAAHTVTELKKS
jgi:MoaA/NifB/PqqE/SkfB family radical SAM enzyme